MKLIFTITILFVIIFMVTGQNTMDLGENHPNVKKIVVKEVLQTTSYTYLQAEENGNLQWLAIPKTEVSVGDTFYIQGGLNMVDFKSKELNRTFSSVLFLNGVVDPEIVEGGKTITDGSPQKSKTVEEKLDINIAPPSEGITLEELFSNKDKYGSKVVKIRGKVTKFNSNIMNRNWIHVQDGTSNSGEFDLTITSMDEVKVGDIITVEGIITLDKDFGAGYFYSVIMENGKVSE
ncbi:MAG: hypothetical protein K8R53_08335 [Bacteroidales bacterium]|nr:hypothetical protein [Bacteroidales bacterium]